MSLAPASAVSRSAMRASVASEMWPMARRERASSVAPARPSASAGLRTVFALRSAMRRHPFRTALVRKQECARRSRTDAEKAADYLGFAPVAPVAQLFLGWGRRRLERSGATHPLLEGGSNS